jgi:hypothetical protein
VSEPLPPGPTAPAEPEEPVAGGPAAGGTRRRRAWLTTGALIQAVTQGSSVVVTILAIFLALVIGGILIVFSDPIVTKAWSHLFSAPGFALGQTWDSVSFAYSQMFEGAILNPATISAAFHGGSIAAIFR